MPCTNNSMTTKRTKPSGRNHNYLAGSVLADTSARVKYGMIEASEFFVEESPSHDCAQCALNLPESLYLRLKQTAQGMHQPFDNVLLRAVQVGSPPAWEDAPAAFQPELAALDRLDDESLWRIARSAQFDQQDWTRYHELLERNSEGVLTSSDRSELERLRTQADRFMLRKAHAAALLRWRGHLPPPTLNL